MLPTHADPKLLEKRLLNRRSFEFLLLLSPKNVILLKKNKKKRNLRKRLQTVDFAKIAPSFCEWRLA